MKQATKKAIGYVGRIGSFLCPPVVIRAMRSFRDSFYTGYISRRFQEMGDSSFTWKALDLKGCQYIHIGNGNIFEAGLQLAARKTGPEPPIISIGNNCLIRYGCHITACNSITIGDNLLTGTNVLITDNAHGTASHEQMDMPPRKRPVVSKGEVVIGNNVWLGNNVCILPGVTIGDGAIVGANSIVTHDIPPYSTAAGIPAEVIKQY